MPSNWIELVPVCTDVYMYQADLICEDCGNKIIEQLKKEGVEGNRPLPKGRGFPKLNDVEHAISTSVSCVSGSPRAAIPQQADTRDSQVYRIVV